MIEVRLLLVTTGLMAISSFVLLGGIESLALLILGGIVPGTTIVIPPVVMLSIALILLATSLIHFSLSPVLALLRHVRQPRSKKSRAELPKRRFSSL